MAKKYLEKKNVHTHLTSLAIKVTQMSLQVRMGITKDKINKTNKDQKKMEFLHTAGKNAN